MKASEADMTETTRGEGLEAREPLDLEGLEAELTHRDAIHRKHCGCTTSDGPSLLLAECRRLRAALTEALDAANLIRRTLDAVIVKRDALLAENARLREALTVMTTSEVGCLVCESDEFLAAKKLAAAALRGERGE